MGPLMLHRGGGYFARRLFERYGAAPRAADPRFLRDSFRVMCTASQGLNFDTVMPLLHIECASLRCRLMIHCAKRGFEIRTRLRHRLCSTRITKSLFAVYNSKITNFN